MGTKSHTLEDTMEIGTIVVETEGFFKGYEFTLTSDYTGINEKWGERSLKSPKIPYSPRNVSNSLPYDEWIAKYVPKEYVNTETKEWLAFAEAALSDYNFSLFLTIHPDHDQFELIKKRYENTGNTFLFREPETTPDQPPKCNTVLSKEIVEKLGLTVHKNCEEAEGAALYVTPFFNSDTQVLVGGRRSQVWWGLVKLGFCLGGHAEQNQTLILSRITEVRNQLEGMK